jgi:YHS domain-containing protein
MMSFQGSRFAPALAFLLLASTFGPARAENVALLPSAVGAVQTFVSEARSGLALSGYDPISFHLDGEAKPGLAAYELVWGGVGWRFSSAANRAAFLRDPRAFLPRIGGYDATAAASGLVVAADPRFHLVRGERVYLFRNEESRARFAADPSLALEAEARWPSLKGELVQS